MIDAMGGTTSPHYLRFRNLCSTAFSNLRKNANLILNLVALMVHSGVQDIKFEPDAAVGKVSRLFCSLFSSTFLQEGVLIPRDLFLFTYLSVQIQNYFLLHLTEEEALKEFERLLNKTSVMNAMFDAIHDL